MEEEREGEEGLTERGSASDVVVQCGGDDDDDTVKSFFW